MASDGPKFLTVQEAGRALGVTAKSVRDFISAGELKASKIGQWKISAPDLEAFVQARTARRPSLTATLEVRVTDRADRIGGLAQEVIELVKREGEGCEFTYQLSGGSALIRLGGPAALLEKALRLIGRYTPSVQDSDTHFEMALDRE